MPTNEDKLLDVLAKIGDLATKSAQTAPDPNGRRRKDHAREDDAQFGCYIKPLPRRLLAQAATTATKVNPINAAVLGPTVGLVGAPTPEMIAIVVGKCAQAHRELHGHNGERPTKPHRQPHERLGCRRIIRRNAGHGTN